MADKISPSLVSLRKKKIRLELPILCVLDASAEGIKIAVVINGLMEMGLKKKKNKKYNCSPRRILIYKLQQSFYFFSLSFLVIIGKIISQGFFFGWGLFSRIS